MPKQGTIIKLNGGHSIFVAKRKPSDLVEELNDLSSNEFWFVQDGDVEPDDANNIVVRPHDVVALIESGYDHAQITVNTDGIVTEKKLKGLVRRSVTVGETPRPYST